MKESKKLPQWLLRTLSAFILIPLTLYLIWYQNPLFSCFIWLWVAIGWFEWLNLLNRRQHVPTDILIFSFLMLMGVAALNTASSLAYTIIAAGIGATMLAIMGMTYRLSPFWLAGGFLYVAFGAVATISLYNSYTIGATLVTFLFAIIWATDTGSYVLGRWLGRKKLLPGISPSKTWAGFYGGLLLAALTGLGLGYYYLMDASGMLLKADYMKFIGFALMALSLALMAQMGDWFESWVKRVHRVKDAGYLIPGHGGILDRIDSILIAAPFYLIAIILAKRTLPF